ncbi:carboxymuconolactone decarboxylase family protein [Rhodobiaceae bacterium]|nr:carboxymuconolactone decarboxylase family protein [Rhodobiaceae bacterium]
MARLPLLTAENAGEEARGVLEILPATLNIFRIMAHAETTFAPQLQLGSAILTRQKLSHIDRELLILLVSKVEGGEYEWHQHCPIALAVGITQSQIDALERLEFSADHFSPPQQALLAFGHQVIENVRTDSETFGTLKENFSDQEVVEMILTIGFYMTMVRLTETTETDLDDADGVHVFESARAEADS